MAQPRTIFLLALVAAAVLLATYKRRGQTVVVDEIDEIVVTGQRIAAQVAEWLARWRAQGQPYREHFERATARYGLPPDLLARQAWQESRMRADARSPKGAVGIMQIIPRWHPDLDPGDAAADERAALDPARAIDYAARYLRQLFDRFGTWPLALAAYNAGPGNVAKYGGIPPFAETIDYVRDITRDVGLA